MKAKELTQVELIGHFKYKYDQLWRKLKGGSWRVVENKVHSRGYCLVGFNGRRYCYHRLVWTLVNGNIPAGLEIDHVDGIRTNNKLSNLRLVSSRQNHQNQTCHREGHLVGTCFARQTDKWMASIRVGGKLKYLGLFTTQQEAHEAYLSAVAKIKEA